jgi:hypothetical protein
MVLMGRFEVLSTTRWYMYQILLTFSCLNIYTVGGAPVVGHEAVAKVKSGTTASSQAQRWSVAHTARLFRHRIYQKPNRFATRPKILPALTFSVGADFFQYRALLATSPALEVCHFQKELNRRQCCGLNIIFKDGTYRRTSFTRQTFS